MYQIKSVPVSSKREGRLFQIQGGGIRGPTTSLLSNPCGKDGSTVVGPVTFLPLVELL